MFQDVPFPIAGREGSVWLLNKTFEKESEPLFNEIEPTAAPLGEALVTEEEVYMFSRVTTEFALFCSICPNKPPQVLTVQVTLASEYISLIVPFMDENISDPTSPPPFQR